MPTDAKPFTAEEIAAEIGRVDGNCDAAGCLRTEAREHEKARRWLATVGERDARLAELEAERERALEYLLRATAMTQPPSTAPSKLIAMAAIARQQAKVMHDGLHDAVAETARVLNRAEDAEKLVKELEAQLRAANNRVNELMGE